MTAHVLKGDRERCLESEMDDYVATPIHAGELFATMNKITEGIDQPQLETETTPEAGGGEHHWVGFVDTIGHDPELGKIVVEAAL